MATPSVLEPVDGPRSFCFLSLNANELKPYILLQLKYISLATCLPGRTANVTYILTSVTYIMCICQSMQLFIICCLVFMAIRW